MEAPPNPIHSSGDSAPAGGLCFGAGTLVWTPEGPVMIETLKVGDRVASTADLIAPEAPGEEEALRTPLTRWRRCCASSALRCSP